jgi:hypothetical protein
MAMALDESFLCVSRDCSGGLGVGLDGRFGYRTGLPRSAWVHVIIVQVEAVSGYRRVPGPEGLVASGHLGAGARIGLLFGDFEPFFVAHFSAAGGSDGLGYLGDVGGALDWRLHDVHRRGRDTGVALSVGLHGIYNRLAFAREQWSMVELGPHFELREFWW